MVSIQHHFPPLAGEDSADIQNWLAALSGVFAPAEIEVVRKACEFAAPLYHGRTVVTGTPLLQHALGSASILIGLNMDHETIAATALHAVPELLEGWNEILTERFGRNVTAMVDGISRMEQIRQFSEVRSAEKDQEAQTQQIESLRKMLLAMVEDIRVVLIKLAERTQTLRTLSGASPAQQKQVAQETHNIFGPLANRLGVWQIKWELEDLSMRYLEPDLYKKIARLLDERRVDRERYITDVLEHLQQALTQHGIKGEVTGRPKHIYSIINKMKRKQLDFDQLYDVRAVRILVEDVEQCYAALSIVHELWVPIQKEFDDYIARPKPNGYRSLHTAVLGPRELSVEVQIRTQQMHHDSELGVAAHWRYKENRKSEGGVDEKIAWLRQILAWKAELADSGEMQEQFRNQLLQDRVYVLTPQGKVIDLPKGATPVDFAYVLHTDLGHRTRGAKVDGSIVPLNYKLQTGQRVEILTTKVGAPSRDWLSPQLGFLKNSRARAKVRHWFSTQNLDASIAEGRTILDRELHRLGVTDINQEKLAQRLRFNKLDELLAAIGRDEVKQNRIATAVQQEAPTKAVIPAKVVAQRPAAPHTSSSGVLIEGVGGLTVRMAKCCKPEPPDRIVGYTTRLGITLHRVDCSCVQRMPQDRRDRLLEAAWAVKKV
ncbi:MAG: bifunctional (p)ppGpp synthetase/guanosine-3',5'-bis(diphosphate) 3'-pyrophosphohydrolase [Nitrosomonadales bacterium]|nr:bifunctional (p)ppGpp synthetase/guanosine-3',5'-bis(diphosphate) 3'-pyrophosphohydrolase [Nitrosomonadales bacterium]